MASAGIDAIGEKFKRTVNSPEELLQLAIALEICRDIAYGPN